jgi:hypothetical protein
MTLGEVPESCMHDKGFGISGLGSDEPPSDIFSSGSAEPAGRHEPTGLPEMLQNLSGPPFF